VDHVDPRLEELFGLARTVRGFMPDDEGAALYEAALLAGLRFPASTMLEVGAWCGKSTLYLGAAAEVTGSVLFSLDHHRGSEENQAGWEHHDAALIDPRDGRLNTLPHWQRSIAEARLEHCVVGLVGDSAMVAAHWSSPLSFCFIDGGHGEEPAWADYRGWTPHVVNGGLLAIHDVFEDPSEGGRPPYEIFRAALDSGLFRERSLQGSLRVLERA
jgi:predicted O-methyltransferase YrrM